MKKKLTLAEAYQLHEETISQAKDLYDRAYRILKTEIRPHLKTKQPVRINQKDAGNALLLVNQFAGTDVVWGHGSVKKWALKLVTLNE